VKRLSDVFDDEMEKLEEEYGAMDVAQELVEEDHTLVWFFIPENGRWSNITRQGTR